MGAVIALQREEILELDGLTKRFGGLTAVNQLSFSVLHGEILGLIGPNGAGKTTVFDLITGFLRPETGAVRFDSEDITGWSTHRVVQAGIARTFQQPKPLRTKAVFHNLELPLIPDPVFTVSRPIEMASQARYIADRVGLLTRLLSPPGVLPQADLRRLEIGRALAAEPQLLLLDEPFAGLSQPEVRKISKLIAALRDEGVTIVLIDHNMRGVMRLVDRVVVMHFGEKIAAGPPKEIAEDEEVLRIYLGSESS